MPISDRFAEHWHLLPEERTLLATRTPHGRIGIAVLLKFFQVHGYFPVHRKEVPFDAIEYIGSQIGVPAESWFGLEWEGPTIKRLRAKIREWLGYREATVADIKKLKTWLIQDILIHEDRLDRLRENIRERCQELHIELPSQKQLLRMIRSALQEHEKSFCNEIYKSLDPITITGMKALLEVNPSQEDAVDWTMWQDLKAEPGKAGLDSVKKAAARLCLLREVGLPAGLFKNIPPKQDFEDRKAAYYGDLGIPLDTKAFTAALREEMTYYLKMLDAQLPSNSKVKIVRKKNGDRISISPFEAQDVPENLVKLKQEVNLRWPGTGLLEILKETDLRINFTRFLRSGTERSHLERATLWRRLLLCVFGLGTNTGIKSMESQPEDAYKDLLYVRRRFLSIEGLRQAIAEVVNATLAVRLPQIWGEATTACASDSKQFGAWDQNLLTEWHLRYGGRGVMVYWQVEKNAACIYSQFKRVSSSEVAAMIQGVLRHCTEMEINRQYVDSHGQSAVAFAFCRLLGFELMPRMKGISRQKLCKVQAGQSLSNLDSIMALRPINWELIEEQLDTMVKHAAALKLGMADAESLLGRFTRNNAQHPAYKALTELGKAIKTIFLCRYLASEDLRREIHEGLNVVESWNSTNGFIFYGNGAELATNRKENQEIGLLCLHLLQASLVYVNTLMIQQVLVDPAWYKQMTARDLAALSPLMTQHINPYGRFELNMDSRIQLEAVAAA